MSTAKAVRKRLARAELLAHLAFTAHAWHLSMLDRNSATKPVGEWDPDDVLVTLGRTYALAPADLAEVLDRIGAILERKAFDAGYGDTWDAVPPPGPGPR